MKRLALAGAVVAVLGCLSTVPSDAAPSGSTVRFTAGSSSTSPAKGWQLSPFRTPFTGAAEPTIGVTADGTVFSDVQTKVVRSKDRGRSWQDVTPPGHVTSLDPYLYVDKKTSRVYKSDLAGTCQLLSYSDDKGESWTSVPAACNLSDHQSLSAARPVSSPTVGYPNVLYSCSQTLGYNGYSMATGCDKSLDGGISWVPTGAFPFNNPSPYGVGPGSGDSGIAGICGGNAGQAHAGPDGSLYIARGWCGQPWLAVSKDEGLTWTRSQVAKNGMNTSVSGGFGLVAPGSGQSDHEASVVVDGKGGVYVVWMALDRRPYLAVSRDGGATFGPPLRISAPAVKEAWGPALDIDSRGRLAVAYMASTDSPGAPWTGSYAGTTFTGWVSVVERPLDRAPVVVAGPASPADAPMVKGACGPGRCNAAVLDFIDVTMGPAGDAWASFVDSNGRRLVVARLSSDARPELAEVVVHRLVLTGLGVAVAVPLVEATRVEVHAVDVDLEDLAAAGEHHGLGRRQQLRADPLAPQGGHDVELVEQTGGAVVPGVGSERDHCQPDGRCTGEQRDQVALGEQPLQPLRQDRRTGGGGVVLPVEVVEEPSDHRYVGDGRPTDGLGYFSTSDTGPSYAPLRSFSSVLFALALLEYPWPPSVATTWPLLA